MKWNFAHPPRPEQVQITEWLDNIVLQGSSPIQIVSAPTGVGKSPICASLAQQETGIVLVPQRILQDQYAATWPLAPMLKGSANYHCHHAPNCKLGQTVLLKSEGRKFSCRKSGRCDFTATKARFMGSRFGITNYACYFAQRHHDTSFEPHHKWLLCDEGHNLEEALISAATFEIKEDMWEQVTPKPRFRVPQHYEDAIEYARIFKERGGAAYARAIASLPEGRPMSAFWIEVGELVDSIGFMLATAQNHKWCYIPGFNAFSFKPVTSAMLYQRLISGRSMDAEGNLKDPPRVLILSATPPPFQVVNDWAAGADVPSIEVDSPFPVENRLIKYTPIGAFNKDTTERLIPTLQNHIRRILADHPDEKGLIHCHTFKLAQAIAAINDPRLLVQTRETKRDELLQKHLLNKGPTVLVSPSMTEGIDLKDDLARFCILCKVPFPSLGDAWVRERVGLSQAWYNWITAKDIVQGVGRTVRHDQDFSVTYILDGTFGNFYDKHYRLFPKWFRRAIV